MFLKSVALLSLIILWTIITISSPAEGARGKRKLKHAKQEDKYYFDAYDKKCKELTKGAHGDKFTSMDLCEIRHPPKARLGNFGRLSPSSNKLLKNPKRSRGSSLLKHKGKKSRVRRPSWHSRRKKTKQVHNSNGKIKKIHRKQSTRQRSIYSRKKGNNFNNIFSKPSNNSRSRNSGRKNTSHRNPLSTRRRTSSTRKGHASDKNKPRSKGAHGKLSSSNRRTYGKTRVKGRGGPGRTYVRGRNGKHPGGRRPKPTLKNNGTASRIRDRQRNRGPSYTKNTKGTTLSQSNTKQSLPDTMINDQPASNSSKIESKPGAKNQTNAKPKKLGKKPGFRPRRPGKSKHHVKIVYKPDAMNGKCYQVKKLRNGKEHRTARLLSDCFHYKFADSTNTTCQLVVITGQKIPPTNVDIENCVPRMTSKRNNVTISQMKRNETKIETKPENKFEKPETKVEGTTIKTVYRYNPKANRCEKYKIKKTHHETNKVSGDHSPRTKTLKTQKNTGRRMRPKISRRRGLINKGKKRRSRNKRAVVKRRRNRGRAGQNRRRFRRVKSGKSNNNHMKGRDYDTLKACRADLMHGDDPTAGNKGKFSAMCYSYCTDSNKQYCVAAEENCNDFQWAKSCKDFATKEARDEHVKKNPMDSIFALVGCSSDMKKCSKRVSQCISKDDKCLTCTNEDIKKLAVEKKLKEPEKIGVRCWKVCGDSFSMTCLEEDEDVCKANNESPICGMNSKKDAEELLKFKPVNGDVTIHCTSPDKKECKVIGAGAQVCPKGYAGTCLVCAQDELSKFGIGQAPSPSKNLNSTVSKTPTQTNTISVQKTDNSSKTPTQTNNPSVQKTDNSSKTTTQTSITSVQKADNSSKTTTQTSITSVQKTDNSSKTPAQTNTILTEPKTSTQINTVLTQPSNTTKNNSSQASVPPPASDTTTGTPPLPTKTPSAVTAVSKTDPLTIKAAPTTQRPATEAPTTTTTVPETTTAEPSTEVPEETTERTVKPDSGESTEREMCEIDWGPNKGYCFDLITVADEIMNLKTEEFTKRLDKLYYSGFYNSVFGKALGEGFQWLNKAKRIIAKPDLEGIELVDLVVDLTKRDRCAVLMHVIPVPDIYNNFVEDCE